MKTKRIPHLPPGKLVRCSVCKKPNCTNRQVVGDVGGSPNYGGNSVCKECFKKLQKIDRKYKPDDYESDGEAQAYRSYGVY